MTKIIFQLSSNTHLISSSGHLISLNGSPSDQRLWFLHIQKLNGRFFLDLLIYKMILRYLSCTNCKAIFFTEQVAVLKGHTGLVKGITWDPVGKYLASQVRLQNTVKFPNFGTPEIFAVIYLNFNQRGQT